MAGYSIYIAGPGAPAGGAEGRTVHDHTMMTP